ncbi:MAG: SusC/RagA family TonB-linked outer membrane protein, partial [Bacteroides acidifaciens]|nr:SusC/RagA family TonB-linked outer membrane protein [Bacteroides acidifaciens]
MRKIHFFDKQRYLKYIVLLLLFYPLNILGAQGVISVKGQAMSIKQAIQLIEKNSDYTFFYNAADLKNTTNKNFNCEGSIEEVLKVVFNGSGITYMIKGNEIILKVNKEESTQQQTKKKRSVTGTVVDAENGDPVIGATVVVKGQKDGVITDLDGNFTISVSGSRVQLEFSYIGYKKKTVDVGDLGVINVKMESDNQLLSEVVVVGAGTQKKVSVTGSITSVKGMTLKAPSSSLTSSFAGKLSGVIAMTKSGEPGAASEFYIRGVSTFGGRATPLILLDDVEISTSDLNNLPAETIESFSILKDASATAIYGARGANGVMLITTKTGKENEKTRINVTLENSFNKPMNMPKFVDGATWMELYNEAQTTRNPQATPKYTQQAIDNTRNHINPYVYPDVDWQDMIFKNMNMNQRVNVNISGGGSKASYYMSLQANHDTGLLNTKKVYSYDNNINNWGYNFQNNISYKVTPTTKIDLHMNAQIRNQKGPNYSTSTLFA